MKKKTASDRRAELRGLMQLEVEKGLVSQDELSQVAGGMAAATDELTCKCWCSTGLLSTCKAGTVDAESPALD
jgi:hypothetical protein